MATAHSSRMKKYGDKEYGDGAIATATELPNRRKFYKDIDKWAKKLELRYIPSECEIQNLDGVAPTVDKETVWATMYSEAASLVRHDDSLNWQKFHYMVLFNAALITGFGVAFQFNIILLLVVFPLIGMLFSWLFDLTLQEGMRCLRAHKEKVRALDSKALGPGKHFMFMDNPWNHRDALELGPLLLACFWLLTLLVPLSYLILGIPGPSNQSRLPATSNTGKSVAAPPQQQPVNPVAPKPASAAPPPQQPVNPVTPKPASATPPQQQPVNPVVSKPSSATAP